MSETWSFSDFVDAAKKIGTSGADVYHAWTGTGEADEETAYLRGQLAGLQSAQAQQQSADTIKVGDMEISTSSILWIVGGTLGLLAIGLGLKKMM